MLYLNQVGITTVRNYAATCLNSLLKAHKKTIEKLKKTITPDDLRGSASKLLGSYLHGNQLKVPIHYFEIEFTMAVYTSSSS